MPTLCFQREIRALRKKFPSIDREICDGLARDVCPDPSGIAAGQPIRGYAGLVFKIRFKNVDSHKGKRGGYRVIYEWHPDKRCLWLLSIYTHDEKDDVVKAEIDRARKEAEIA